MRDIVTADLDRCRTIAAQVTRGSRAHLRDEAESAATEGLVKAARSYDPTKGTWPAHRDTYLRQAARNAVQKEIGRATPGSVAWCLRHPLPLHLITGGLL